MPGKRTRTRASEINERELRPSMISLPFGYDGMHNSGELDPIDEVEG
jgi:hypothetical protein